MVRMTLRKGSLGPFEAAMAVALRKEGLSYRAIAKRVRTFEGAVPKEGSLRRAVTLSRSVKGGDAARLVTDGAWSRYGKSGRRRCVCKADETRIIKYVEKWRAKSFCSGPQIKADLKLACSPRTIQRVLNRRGLRWTPVSRKLPLKKGQREARREWAERHADKGPQWWKDNVGLILDGVTLSLPPTGLTEKQRHAAQAITHTWLRKGERQDSDLATRNPYGGQLGEKVPLWGGFTGDGEFTLRWWTPRAKMPRAEWVRGLSRVKAALKPGTKKVWHDNEPFLKVPAEYRSRGMQMCLFPPNSADLNPIETVWARLRRRLHKKTMENCRGRRTVGRAGFVKRAAALLKEFGDDGFYTRLLAGMPRRVRQVLQRGGARCDK